MSNPMATLNVNIVGPVRAGRTGHVNVPSFARAFGVHPAAVWMLVVRAVGRDGQPVADGEWIRVYPI